MASSLVRFNCASKVLLRRAPRPTISSPTSHATPLFVRSLLTTPNPEPPSQQVTAQVKRLQSRARSARTQSRSVQTQPTNPKPNHDPITPKSLPSQTLLAQQRLNRPVAPHLSIYRRQITSVLSVLQRLTGLTLSAAFSLFPILYLSSTHLGLGLDLSAETIAASFGSLPWIVKSVVKFGVAWVFTFHGLNSLRFLAWKFARGVTNKDVAVSGWTVAVGSIVGAVGFVWVV